MMQTISVQLPEVTVEGTRISMSPARQSAATEKGWIGFGELKLGVETFKVQVLIRKPPKGYVSPFRGK